MDHDSDHDMPLTEDTNVETYDDEEFLLNLVTSPDISLDSYKSNLTAPVWKEFGILKKGGRVLQALKDKVHCKLCFVNKVLKRLHI